MGRFFSPLPVKLLYIHKVVFFLPVNKKMIFPQPTCSLSSPEVGDLAHRPVLIKDHRFFLLNPNGLPARSSPCARLPDFLSTERCVPARGGSARPSESVLWLLFPWTLATLSAAAASGRIKQTSRSVESSPKEASLALKQWKRKHSGSANKQKKKKIALHCVEDHPAERNTANKQFEEESSVSLSRTWQPDSS